MVLTKKVRRSIIGTMIKKPISGAGVEEHLRNIEPDSLDIFLLADGTLRGAIAHGTGMVNQMRANHELGILESYVLGEAYLAAGLLSSQVKGNDRISLAIECGGPIGGLSVETDAQANVRGYLSQVPIPVEAPLESFDLSPFFGPGFLKVSKHLENAKQPFSGQIMLREGSIAKDLAWYFLESEQTKSFFALSIQFDKQGNISGAGGLFLQELPGADPETLALVQESARELPSLGTGFAAGATGKALVEKGFASFRPVFIGTRNMRFFCSCSKERFSSFLAGMQGSQQEDILKQDDFPLKIECHNCGSIYHFSRIECEQLFSN
jgi:molecular chaperone Hsp33